MSGLRTDALTIPQGVTYGVQWPIRDSDGEAVDLTGWSARAQVRTSAGSPVVAHEWSTAKGNLEIVGSTVILTVEPAESSDWGWSRGEYDVELTSLDGTVHRVTQGVIHVSPEITRD